MEFLRKAQVPACMVLKSPASSPGTGSGVEESDL